MEHSWATAVEVVGTFTKQALKASSGESIWLDFFKYASIEFAKLEDCSIDPNYLRVDTFRKLDYCVERLEIKKRLKAFNVAVKTVIQRSRPGTGYFLLKLDLKQRLINLRAFTKDELEQASQTYNSEEKVYRDNNNIDLVLVSAESVRDLKKAYPNYFSDTEIFYKNLELVYSVNRR